MTAAPTQPDWRDQIFEVFQDHDVKQVYHVPDASGLVKLDAMENPFRLPEPLQKALGERLGRLALHRYPAERGDDLKAALAVSDLLFDRVVGLSGIDYRRARLHVFLISSAGLGVIGAFYAQFYNSISPQVFSLDQLMLLFAMIVIGGLGRSEGAVIGTAIVVLIDKGLLNLGPIRILLVYPPGGISDQVLRDDTRKTVLEAQERVAADNAKNGTNTPLPTMDDIRKDYGASYREMMAEVRTVIDRAMDEGAHSVRPALMAWLADQRE